MDLYFVNYDKNNLTEVPEPIYPYEKLYRCHSNHLTQCDQSMPYICTHGLVKGACTSDPHIWQDSRMCKAFCDVRIPVPKRIPRPYPLYVGLRDQLVLF